MTEQQRIVELVLHQVGFEGPRTVRIGPSYTSGAHTYRQVMVDGHRPLVCQAAVADLLQNWLDSHAGGLARFADRGYRISHRVDDGHSAIVKIVPVWPVEPE